MIKRFVAVLIYYICSPIGCGVLAAGIAVNQAPFWQALIAPIIYGTIMLYLDGPEFPLPQKWAGFGLGGLAVALSAVGYLIGPNLAALG